MQCRFTDTLAEEFLRGVPGLWPAAHGGRFADNVFSQTASSQSLDEGQAQSWLVALNDIRLVQKTRLTCSQSGCFAHLPF